jgi:hypothetical protein
VIELVEPDMLILARSGSYGASCVRERHRALAHGEPLFLRFPQQALHAFDAITGARLP